MNEPSVSMPESQDIQAAFFYLMGRCLVVRQEIIDTKQTPYNAIKYNPLGAESSDFVNPNMDVAYLEAWIAVDDTHAVVMNVPEIQGRYYTVQIMDGWAEVIANVNDRNNPEHSWGKIAFVKKGTSPDIPEDALKIELPSYKTKILARVELSDSPEEAVRLQRAFTLDVPEGIRISPPPGIPAFHNPELPGAWMFEMADALLVDCPDAMPDAPRLQSLVEKVREYIATGDDAKTQIQQVIDTKLTPYFFQTLLGGRPARGGWMITDYGGRFGNEYELRGLVNFGGIWANVPEEAVYYTCHKDADGKPFAAGSVYTMTFGKDNLPGSACSAFWSLTLLRMPDYHAVPNALNRFSINNVSDLKYDADGSLTLYVAPKLPDGAPQGNWLPSSGDAEIVLVFRLYLPKENAMRQQWFVPPMQRMK